MNPESTTDNSDMSFKSQLEYDLLKNLNRAEQAVRLNLYVPGLDETARRHMERALSHIREGCLAIRETGTARTVSQLATELEKSERLIEALRRRPRPEIRVKSHHV